MANIGSFDAVATLVLSVSLATERLVAIAKTAAPTFLADEKKTAAHETDLVADKGRRIRVLAVAILAAFVTSALIGDDSATWYGIPTHVVASDGTRIATFMLAILASGGSAFWTSIIGYATAAKDVKTQQRSADGLRFRIDAERSGITSADSGMTAQRTPLAPTTVTTAPPATITSGQAALNYAGGRV